jgi:hypothetical protein
MIGLKGNNAVSFVRPSEKEKEQFFWFEEETKTLVFHPQLLECLPEVRLYIADMERQGFSLVAAEPHVEGYSAKSSLNEDLQRKLFEWKKAPVSHYRFMWKTPKKKKILAKKKFLFPKLETTLRIDPASSRKTEMRIGS